MDMQALLDISCCDHDHLCPRQVLGVRIGLRGIAALGYNEPPSGKQLLAIVESDGCFADGVSAATRCTLGHRTMRFEDYGKTAATLVRADTGQAVRITPTADCRDRAAAMMPDESRWYAMLRSYQLMPDEQLLTVTEVQLAVPIAQIISRPGVRTSCEACGEEIINEREIVCEGRKLCRACAGHSYYVPAGQGAGTKDEG